MTSSKSRYLIAAALLCAAPAFAEDVFIAGTEPSHRPTGAPEITQVTKDGTWYASALTGVSQPYPYSLRFLENQGHWFQPFIHPGMTGPYDIRGWHQP